MGDPLESMSGKKPIKEVETVLHKKQTPVGGREKGGSSQEVREREKAERERAWERERQTDTQTESKSGRESTVH